MKEYSKAVISGITNRLSFPMAAVSAGVVYKDISDAVNSVQSSGFIDRVSAAAATSFDENTLAAGICMAAFGYLAVKAGKNVEDYNIKNSTSSYKYHQEINKGKEERKILDKYSLIGKSIVSAVNGAISSVNSTIKPIVNIVSKDRLAGREISDRLKISSPSGFYYGVGKAAGYAAQIAVAAQVLEQIIR
ncbi:MAG: hypothetical protein ACP5N3_04460 [Candidatus Nanoarchaeia archaeon]